MRKVYSDKSSIVICIFGLILFTTIAVCASFVPAFVNEPIILISYISFFTLLDILCLFGLNRWGYKIFYDKEKNIIYRRGFLFGYKYQINLNDLIGVMEVSFPRENTFYILVDSKNTKYDAGYKKSFIRIKKTENNLEFIRLFWDKQIIKIKEYSELFKKL